MRKDDSSAARRAYNRHDKGISPDEISDNVPEELLNDLMSGFYQTKVAVTEEKAKEIEERTRNQAESEQWALERRQRVTASKFGNIVKMRVATKRSKKVEELLYSSFGGNTATRYGILKETETVQQYVTHQKNHRHPHLTDSKCGLIVSTANGWWLAASPDGLVYDPTDAKHPHGLLEVKNPFSVRDKELDEAYKSSGFCLQKKDSMYKLKVRHDYYFQVQCQLNCANRSWCDFVLRTNKYIHIERIQRDKSWWEQHLEKAKEFFFTSLLPELACPMHRKGGIRESVTYSY